MGEFVHGFVEFGDCHDGSVGSIFLPNSSVQSLLPIYEVKAPVQFAEIEFLHVLALLQSTIADGVTLSVHGDSCLDRVFSPENQDVSIAEREDFRGLLSG
jgi:hypothetical protein